ncbi:MULTISPECIES: hypothetical protein [Rhizobium/Agrobacterium group]|uniref:Cthe-2314-like HEPN domain-containing protein n=2 Tax=Rhizobium/Agrobacterium group TaxID=227290 RepID=B9K496_ALLAM|nr:MULTISPECIES: hypothetical protein [Rhizobium/Agrobacterium group]ACM39546.1 hypothetical protein Avi_8004 [Allorhizobium ampelinum S4]ASK49774.1 hypothetical protein [Agrobacterium vitis]MCF1436630.1 hypothetical protein [Allorhizobium ampelinum]MCF1450277.1 hypothetical protein [Allorhizobium ampelinum]MCF1495894.1 hypothetical protein [Allorhizobium ampelinum]
MGFDDEYGFREVEFSLHEAQAERLFIRGKNAANDQYFDNQARENHIYSVNNALNQLLGDAAVLVELGVLTQTADYFMRFGVLRRLRMMISSFRNLQSIIMPDRTVPLTMDQSDEVCRDLNAIYVNILGLLDNYAWTIVHQVGSVATQAAKPLSVSLFKPMFAADPALSNVAATLRSFATWETDVKKRRNPAAHRMPLYVPPAGYDREATETLRDLDQQISTALREQDFDKMHNLQRKRERVGIFVPIFVHDPGEEINDIYPTLPQDLGQMVKIGRISQTFLRKQHAPNDASHEGN